VIQRLEEVLVGHLDVAHPAQQIQSSRVADGEFDELASYGDVRRSFGDVEPVRYWLFAISAPLL